jgi:hypothetical protein
VHPRAIIAPSGIYGRDDLWLANGVTGVGPKAAARVAKRMLALVAVQRKGVAEAERAAPELRAQRV